MFKVYPPLWIYLLSNLWKFFVVLCWMLYSSTQTCCSWCQQPWWSLFLLLGIFKDCYCSLRMTSLLFLMSTIMIDWLSLISCPRPETYFLAGILSHLRTYLESYLISGHILNPISSFLNQTVHNSARRSLFCLYRPFNFIIRNWKTGRKSWKSYYKLCNCITFWEYCQKIRKIKLWFKFSSLQCHYWIPTYLSE